jgi:hypothetical protein
MICDESRGQLSQVILGAFTALRDLPVDVLLGRLDVARLAVNAAVERKRK